MAYLHNITVATLRKWKGRENFQDRSYCSLILNNTTLTPTQELLVDDLCCILNDGIFVRTFTADYGGII